MTETLPVEHVERPPLPWRAASITECGLPCAGHPVITRDEFVAKVRQQGKQRASFTTCMTCWDTAQRWPTWDENPVVRMQRETYGTSRYGGRAHDDMFRAELLAIAEIVGRHREEFDGIIEGLAGAADFRSAQAARRRRRSVS